MFHDYNHIISLPNLYQAWREFVRGKKYKKDVAEFALNLSTNIYQLHHDLTTKTYTHSGYYAFNISDPKPRNIHKASVRDRLLHHALYRSLYWHFNQKFIYDSYSCRLGKGTHKALNRFKQFSYKASRNHTKTLWVLKCDVKKFFASIDQEILLKILEKHLTDPDTLNLLKTVIHSFPHGLPLGNLTSQLLVNVYMNEFDQFMKHALKVKYYLRYADDFVIMSPDKLFLENLLLEIKDFLEAKLKLNLHPNKIFLKTLASGVDFLGWVHFPNHRVLRTVTKRRMFEKIKDNPKPETVQSYLGLLQHGNTHKLQKLVLQ
ncbi:MAG: reverse transcriptase/maturase family protein [bacterium]|nr:reverse transcriptase/maturase family protein [bacterium]